MGSLNYLELPVADTKRARAFYQQAFGWGFVEYASTYAATTDRPVNIGLQGDATEKTAMPLPVIEVSDLEAAKARVLAAGGTITRPAFGFPGGRRFHFRDPDGHELAVASSD